MNISPETLCSPDATELLERVANSRLVVELTEHSQVDDYEALQRTITGLRSQGVRIAVDDAGSAFASLRHILRVRPDIIKIDVAITRGIDTDSARRALAASLVTFGREIDATVVAEGIETREELETLRGLELSYGQGSYLAYPDRLPILPCLNPGRVLEMHRTTAG